MYFHFYTSFGSSQGLFLALSSGITPNGTHGDHILGTDLELATCNANTLTSVLYLLLNDIFRFLATALALNKS